MMSVVLYICETWSFRSMEEYRGDYLGRSSMRIGSAECSTIRKFIVCTVHLMELELLYFEY